MPSHSIAKSGVKPIFPPLPHPTFSLQNLRFPRFSPFRTRFRAIFRGNALIFCPRNPLFLVFPRFGADCRRFFEGTSLFQPRTSIFPRSVLYSPTLRALLREISPFIFPALPFLHCVKVFPIRLFPLFILCSTFLFPLISFPPLIHPTLHLLPHFFSFLPTFPFPSPINARSRAPSRTTRVRVRLHIPTRQEVFVYCLHRFTHLPQSTVHQRVRGERKTRKSLHQTLNHPHNVNILTQSIRFSSAVNFISSPR